MKTLLIVGATSSMAEASLNIWLKQGFDKVILVARNKQKLDILAKDVSTKYINKIIVEPEIIDFQNPLDIQSTMNSILKTNSVDVALIAHGSLIDNDKCLRDFKLLSEEVYATAISPVIFLELIIAKMEEQKYGHIGIIGSVAGDRGRLTNYIYGASKGFIEIYWQGIVHKLKNQNSKITVTLIKPGPTATPMTASITGKGKLADVKDVAYCIVNAVNHGKAVLYTPSKWRLIMFIIRNLPMLIFKNLKI